MDWYSRYILSWEVSNSLDVGFCLDALDSALQNGCPEVFNPDQGSHFTSHDFTQRLESHGIRLSQDGRGRAHDNIWNERFWRSVKYEEVYLHDYHDISGTVKGLRDYMQFYNRRRPHQALGYQTPAELYHGGSASR